MRVLLGSAAAVLLLAGCGEQRAPIATDDPTESPTTSTSASETPSETATPAATATPTPDHRVETIPADFPLLDGLPADDEAERGPHYGSEGPSRELDPLVPQACGEQVRPPADADLLRGGWASIEDFRERQLLDFATAAQAQAYADRVLELYRSCPVEKDQDRAALTTVDETGLGDAAGVARTVYEQQGSPVPGQTTTHVVRAGTAVLLAITSNEGGSDRTQGAEETAETAAAIGGVVEAMGIFREEEHPSEPPFGPDGFGEITLGMDRAELEALPGVRIGPGNDQCDWFEAAGVGGFLQPGFGVGALSLSADASTPEGIQVGSTYVEVRAAYPDAEGDRILLAANPPGLDDRYYRFEFGLDERIDSLKLVHDDQHCAG